MQRLAEHGHVPPLSTECSGGRAHWLPAWLPQLRSAIYRCERVECLFEPLRAAPCRRSSSNFRRVSAVALSPHRRCVHGRKGSPRCFRLAPDRGRTWGVAVGGESPSDVQDGHRPVLTINRAISGVDSTAVRRHPARHVLRQPLILLIIDTSDHRYIAPLPLP